MSSSSPGVCRLLDDVWVVLDEIEGCSVASEGGMRGGVTEVERQYVDS
jgi:hypothetical protein